jgi:hypothetical protein
VLFPALAPPSCCVIAEPKLLLPWVQRVCALAAHVRQIDLTALESSPALTNALFDPPLPIPFLHPNCQSQRRGLCCLHSLRSLILKSSSGHMNPLSVVDEFVCKTAKELAITSLLVALVNNMLMVTRQPA